jgi:hypothetical protein
LQEALPLTMRMGNETGIDFPGAIVSLDGFYGYRAKRKAISMWDDTRYSGKVIFHAIKRSLGRKEKPEDLIFRGSSEA